MTQVASANEVRYVCGRCKQSVRVFVPATVRCSRCGRPMQAASEPGDRR